MRNRILDTITLVGLRQEDFLIGYGAKSEFSEIHLYISPQKNLAGVKYAIQYFDNSITIWNIEKRIEIGASLNLYYKRRMYWKDIKELRYKMIMIKDCLDEVEAAIMPYDAFEPYLRAKIKTDDDEKYFIHEERQKNNSEEGKRISIYTTKFERNPLLRAQAIQIHGTKCQACGFSFEKTYGDIGIGYIEVHHLKPVSEGVRKTNPKTDLACLCSNCHSMIHKNPNQVMSLESLKRLVSLNERKNMEK